MPTAHPAAVLALSALAAAGHAASPIVVDVDARDIARRLVHATIAIPIPEGAPRDAIGLYFVEWTPGNHNPSGPIQNLVDFRVETASGARLDWRRDERNMFRKVVSAPAGAEGLVVRLSYITNQPGVNSRSSDTYGFPTFGGLNWNTVLIYPEWADARATTVRATLTLPAAWTAASGLRAELSKPGVVRFAPTSLTELVDSPVIFGEHLRSWEMSAPPGAGGPARHLFHAVAHDPADLELPAARLEKFNRMHEQSERVFGPFPYDRFHYLILLGDDLPGFGLEHATSTYISMRTDRFRKAEGPEGDPMGVVPHEYAHVWCGKFVAPEGLLGPEFHTPADVDLMWVYEGLVSYYDDLLSVRSGLLTNEEYEHIVTSAAANYQLQAGRRWRSVEDTAIALRYLRAPSDAWVDLRRNQDYYGEAALFWMAADAIIREGTGGSRSLDDFSRAFFGVRAGETIQPPGAPTRTYTRADVVSALDAVHRHDWDGMIREMLERPAASPELALPGLLHRRFEWASEPTELQKKDERSDTGANLRWSIGLRTDAGGVITAIVPGSPADRAGLAFRERIVAVDDGAGGMSGAMFSPRALRAAVAKSAERPGVGLVVQSGDRLRLVELDYEGGARYPRLTPMEGKRDLLGEIVRPR